MRQMKVDEIRSEYDEPFMLRKMQVTKATPLQDVWSDLPIRQVVRKEEGVDIQEENGEREFESME